MQIVFDDGAGRRELDVRVNNPSASVADLAAALDPRVEGQPLLFDDRRVDPDLELREAGLHEGAVVRLAGPGRGPLATGPSGLAGGAGPAPPTVPITSGPPLDPGPAPGFGPPPGPGLSPDPGFSPDPGPAHGFGTRAGFAPAPDTWAPSGTTPPLPGPAPSGTSTPATPARTPVPLELVVVNGLDAGRRFPLEPGTSTVGRGPGCDVVLRHDTVSKQHATLTTAGDGTVTVADLDSHNGTWVAGQPVTGSTAVAEEVPFRLGALELEVRRRRDRDRPLTLDPWRDVNPAGTIPFNRPPRSALPPPLAEVRLPQPPKAGGGRGSLSIVSIVAPLIFAGAMFAILKSPHYLLFAGLSPIMAIGNAVDSRRKGRKSERSERERFRREVAQLRDQLAERAGEERARRRDSCPDPAEIVRRVTLPSTTLWERRPPHPDFLRLRVGVGDVPWDPPVAERHGGHGAPPPEEVATALAEAATLRDAAVPVDLAGGGVLGIVGDRTAALSLARSLVCQAAVLHGPADLPTMILAEPDAGPAWDWAKWLPHTRGPSGVDRVLSQDRDLSTRIVEARLEAARARAGQERGGRRGGGAGHATTGPTQLVVVDDESLTTGRYAPTRNLLRGDAGPVAGIVVARSADRLPALCTAVVDMAGPDGEATLLLPQRGQRVDGFLACGVADDVARECARSLACYEDPELDLVGAGLPASIRLLPLLDLDDCTPEAVRDRWERSAANPTRVAAPIGVTESGALPVDLVADGPHGLVGGTTGAGKSELLRTIVAGLAATLDPDHLTFVLIDFKGGSAFDECAKLPHTVGMVTDLDEHLAERALRCLEAELKHRERLLRRAGAVDLPDYLRSQASRTGEPLPRLVVVIDEFATLKAELPQFIDALVGVAQRGRSLGVHLLLATQRPQGAISENIKANTNLRIALRVQSPPDSTDIIEVPDAAGIPRTAPGRAYVRLGPGEVVAIQTALATGERSDAALAPVDLAPFVYGPQPRPPEPAPPPAHSLATLAADPAPAPAADPAPDPDPDSGSGSGGLDGSDGSGGAVGTGAGDDTRETDLSVLVGAIDAAFAATGRPLPRRPWPDPLPRHVDLDALIDQAVAAAPTGAPPAFVPLAMADDPDAQTQYPTGWVPRDGNLIVYGIGGSGTTTALSSLALSLARAHAADELHLYALDFGARELEALSPLPHVGAVITAGERERQARLVRVLREELGRRRHMGLAAVEREPMIVTLVDGWSALTAEYGDVAGSQVTDALHRVFADGPEVRMYTVVAAERPNAVQGALASLVRQRWALRLSDPTAYSAFGVRSTAVPEMVPGRALVAGSGQVVQVARPAGGVATAAARLAASAPRPARPPRTIETLSTEVRVRDLRDAAQLGTRPWSIPLGLTEEALAPATLVAYQGEHALVAGPARSGKTTTLLTVAAACRQARPDVTVLAVAGPRSALAHHPLVGEVVRPSTIGDLLQARVDAVAAGGGPVLLLIDDAETVDDTGELLARLSTSDRPELLVVAAGRNDSVRSGYTHWTRRLRRSKLGVLLVPDVDYDGDILGTHVPRRPPVAMTAGRGYLVNSGRSELVQIALPE